MLGRQRGWVGIVMILVALVIVAFLAKEALTQYGFAPGKATVSKAATAGERARAPNATGAEAVDVDSASSTPSSALDRARGVEDMLKRQADERAAQMDGGK